MMGSPFSSTSPVGRCSWDIMNAPFRVKVTSPVARSTSPKKPSPSM
jgi:hypothetical protein